MNGRSEDEYLRLGFSLEDLRIDTWVPSTHVRVTHIPSGIGSVVAYADVGGSVYKGKIQAMTDLVNKLKEAGLADDRAP